MNKDPVFLVSCVRSGSTVLNLMLNSHPDICWIGECDYLHLGLDEQGIPLSDEEYIKRLSRDRIFLSIGVSLPSGETGVKSIAGDVFAALNTSKKRFVGGTLHHRFRMILKIYPNAKFIYLVRDPRDVAKSVAEIGFEGNSFFGVSYWIKAEDAWGELRSSITNERHIQIKYEDLTEKPEKTLTQICEFIGVAYSPQMMDFHKVSSYSPLSSSKNYSWKKNSSSDLGYIEHLLEKRHLKYGYEQIPSRAPNLFCRWLLFIKNRIQRVIKNIRKYGFINYTKYLVLKVFDIGKEDAPYSRRFYDKLVSSQIK